MVFLLLCKKNKFMELITATNVSKHYAEHTALDKVSIHVPKGSIFGLLGPNGAGKTSLIRIINQITAPDEGQVMFEGERLMPHHISQIGYLPEERGLYKKMKVGEQALYLAQLKGLSRQDALKKLKHWFVKFEIQDWWNRKVEELSKGMQQKIQFIVTILHDPKLLIFDEPFSGFDPINVNLLKEEILFQKEKGTTIIFSTHNMASVEELCDYISLINKSKVILEGSVHDIKNTYKNNIYEAGIRMNSENELLLNERFIVSDIEKINGLTHCKVKLADGITVNEMLQNIMPFGQVEILRELIPSMNDIFISQVNKFNAEHNKEE